MNSVYHNCTSVLGWSYHVHTFTHRMIFSLCVFSVLFTILLIRVLYISSCASNLTRDSIKSSILRKDIVDRNGRPLAVNLPVINLFAHPNQILKPKMVAQELYKALPELNYDDIFRKLSSNKNFVWIKKDLNPHQEFKIKKLAIEGVELDYVQARFYPYKNLLSHLIGYTDSNNIGVCGIEKGLQDQIITLNKTDTSINLSIDVRLQQACQSVMTHAQEKFFAKGASVLVVDVETGEILSYVSTPSFDPHKIELDKDAMLNKNALGLYEMGSILKPIILAIGLDTGKISLTDIYPVGKLKIGKYDIQDDSTNAISYYSTAQILSRSSNKGMSKIAIHIGKNSIADYMQRLNLFSELEVKGLPEKTKSMCMKCDRWNNLTLATLSYGYSLAITPLQYIQAMLPIVNDGCKVPLVLHKTDKPLYKEQIFQTVTSKQMNVLLRLTTAYGTCKAMEIPGLEVGGKTGTAKKACSLGYSKNKRISSAVAVFPANKPKYLIYAMLDEPQGISETQGNARAAVTVVGCVQKIILKMVSLYGIKKQNTDLKEAFKFLLMPDISKTPHSTLLN